MGARRRGSGLASLTLAVLMAGCGAQQEGPHAELSSAGAPPARPAPVGAPSTARAPGGQLRPAPAQPPDPLGTASNTADPDPCQGLVPAAPTAGRIALDIRPIDDAPSAATISPTGSIALRRGYLAVSAHLFPTRTVLLPGGAVVNPDDPSRGNSTLFAGAQTGFLERRGARLQQLDDAGAPVGAPVDLLAGRDPSLQVIAVLPMPDGGLFVLRGPSQMLQAQGGSLSGELLDATGASRSPERPLPAPPGTHGPLFLMSAHANRQGDVLLLDGDTSGEGSWSQWVDPTGAAIGTPAWDRLKFNPPWEVEQLGPELPDGSFTVVVMGETGSSTIRDRWTLTGRAPFSAEDFAPVPEGVLVRSHAYVSAKVSCTDVHLEVRTTSGALCGTVPLPHDALCGDPRFFPAVNVLSDGTVLETARAAPVPGSGDVQPEVQTAVYAWPALLP